jgi:hypothetical protein
MLQRASNPLSEETWEQNLVHRAARYARHGWPPPVSPGLHQSLHPFERLRSSCPPPPPQLVSWQSPRTIHQTDQATARPLRPAQDRDQAPGIHPIEQRHHGGLGPH